MRYSPFFMDKEFLSILTQRIMNYGIKNELDISLPKIVEVMRLVLPFITEDIRENNITNITKQYNIIKQYYK